MSLTARMRRALGAREVEPQPGPPAPVVRPSEFLLTDRVITERLDAFEADIDALAPEAIPERLALVPLDVFALLALAPNPRWPKIAAWLPEMPLDGVQLGMTGAAGEQVLMEAAGFIHRLLPAYLSRGGPPLSQANVLDYGIGWARVARLFYKFTRTDRIHGVDAWPPSLDIARSSGFRGPLALIDPAPEELPFKTRFDLVYAFSVFTHLSEGTARAAIRTIAGSLSETGLIAITIRPEAFWLLHEGEDTQARLAEHAETGFAFRPGELPAAGDTYGDASISLDYIGRAWPEVRIVGVEINAADPYQLIVLLAPA